MDEPVPVVLAPKLTDRLPRGKRPPLLQVLLGILILVSVLSQILSVNTLADRNECLLQRGLQREAIVQEVAKGGGPAVDAQIRILALPITEC